MGLYGSHPRIRKTVKWSGAVLTVLLVAVWIGSFKVYVGWRPAPLSAAFLSEGSLWFTSGNPYFQDDPLGWSVQVAPKMLPLTIAPPGLHIEGTYWGACVPVLLPATAVLALTALAFRLDTLARRRASMHLCPKCHYDRTGIAHDAVCPECGTAHPSA